MASSATVDRKTGLGLSLVELRALEQTRIRLQNLTHSLASFKHDLQMNNPLPNPQSLQASAVILKGHTSYLLEHLNKQSSLFQRLAVHPSTNYPGRTQEAVQSQLLRKKLDPQIETLVEAARAEAEAAGISPSASFVSHERLIAEQERVKAARHQAKFGAFSALPDDEDSDDDSDDSHGGGRSGSDGGDGDGGERVNEPIGLGDVWVDCMVWSRQRLARFAAEEGESLYTAEEREMGVENVRTGLRRSLEEEESESEEEDEDDEEDGDATTGGVAPAAAPKAVGSRDRLADRPPEVDVKTWMTAMLAYNSRGDDATR